MQMTQLGFEYAHLRAHIAYPLLGVRLRFVQIVNCHTLVSY